MYGCINMKLRFVCVDPVRLTNSCLELESDSVCF